MKKICCFLALVLLLGCLAGCQSGEHQERSIENADGTLSDWMKEEMYEAYDKKYFEPYGIEMMKSDFGFWWDPEKPMDGGKEYYGTYNGYIMYSSNLGAEAPMEKELAGFVFAYSHHRGLRAYKDGEFYDLEELYKDGVVGDEAIEIAYNGYCKVRETIRQYRKENGI